MYFVSILPFPLPILYHVMCVKLLLFVFLNSFLMLYIQNSNASASRVVGVDTTSRNTLAAEGFLSRWGFCNL